MARKESSLERALAAQIRAAGIPPPEREVVFAPPRRWRADFAWPAHRVIVEVEGGIWSRGRHVSPDGFLRDVEKYNAATELGWRVYRVHAGSINDGSAIALIQRALGAAQPPPAPAPTAPSRSRRKPCAPRSPRPPRLASPSRR